MDTCLQGAICHLTQTLILILMLQNLSTPVDKAKTGDISAIQEETISRANIITMSMHHTMDMMHHTMDTMHHTMDTTHGIMT